MSAAGLVTLAGGNVEQAVAAASMALQSSFGMICDPIANRVEAPCLGRNVAGGANVVCFTTGRGSVFGCKPAPSLKLATNSRLYGHMEDDMDLNCGTIVDGTETIEQAGERIFKLLLETASGRRTKSEALGFGEDEFAPWVVGATM